jgi:hypothetical protein
MNNIQKSFNGKAFISIGTLLFFIGLLVSGIAIQATEHQLNAFWKIYWKATHNLMAIGFIIFALLHTGQNMGALKKYIVAKAKNSVSTELTAGLILLATIAWGCWLIARYLMKIHQISF